MYSIIDSHCHIFPDKIAVKASQQTSDFYDVPVKFDGKISTLKSESAAAGICHCVVFSAATTPHQVASINRYISETVAQSCGRMTGLGTIHPDSQNIEADVDDLISLGLKGVKIHPDIQGFKSDAENCMKIYEVCERKNLPILFHCGDSRYDNSNPNRIKNILETFPKLQVIGAHFGGWSLWEKAANELHKYENFVVDSSSTFDWLDRDSVKEIVNLYGFDRVLFATDYPMWDPKDEIEYMLSLDFTKEEYEKIFHLNAQRVFKIEL